MNTLFNNKYKYYLSDSGMLSIYNIHTKETKYILKPNKNTLLCVIYPITL